MKPFLALLLGTCLPWPLWSQESLWLEAEHFTGIRGYCWPMGKPEMKKTNGNWGISGPGWAAAWNQGGESGYLSIATSAEDDHAVVTKTVEIPAAGHYFAWIRYADWRERTERFQLEIEQAGKPRWIGKYGEKAVIEEDNEMKLYYGWAFAWAKQEVDLNKGEAKLSLKTTTKDPVPRQVDVIVLTTNATYQPLIKEHPKNPAWEILDTYRGGIPDTLEPLSRWASQQSKRESWQLPADWNLHTFRDKGFLYLWNVNAADAAQSWLGDKPNRVKFPYHLIDAKTREEFEKKYAGKDDVPIFSDPRIVPTFHGAGAGIFATDPKSGEVNPAGQLFAKWLEKNPDRHWAMMMNYHPGQPIGEKGIQLYQKYHDRYVGSISGENLGYFDVKQEEMKKTTEQAKTRREVVQAFTPLTLRANAEKYRKIYGRDVDANSYQDVIACLSEGNMAFFPLFYDWGARTIGYESTASTSSLLSMRWAFMRGAARQHSGLTATYRSCNFGDAATIFSNTSSYTSPQNILDNYYSVYSGAGMTWYKMDIWYQYMAGASMFYHEQGFDEYWQPGGTTAAGIHEVQLSPKGKLVDRFLRVTKQHPERGMPYTPVAFLVDYAHGWEPAGFWPNAFRNWFEHEDRFLHSDHEAMLEQYFWTAYHPIGRESEKPITGTNEVYVPGVFGDIFDCMFAYPDVKKWKMIDSYPVLIAAGDMDLTESEGRLLLEYVQRGGTLFVAEGHLTGPGLKTLDLPAVDAPSESKGYRCLNDQSIHPSQQFRFRPIILNSSRQLRMLAQTADGKVFCAAEDRGQGRIIYLSVVRGMGIDRQIHPVVPRLFAHITRGLMPIEVRGDVEWMVNRTSKGWIVTLLNPAGQAKPQQGITPTDYRENRRVTILPRVTVKNATDWLMPDDPIDIGNERISLTVPAGAVRIIELMDK